jgi:hypothetical protein
MVRILQKLFQLKYQSNTTNLLESTYVKIQSKAIFRPIIDHHKDIYTYTYMTHVKFTVTPHH